MNIKLSKGNSKIGNIYNVSMRPIKDCLNCEHCKKDCYALKAWRQYKQTRAAWTHNGKAFNKDLNKCKEDIINQLKRKKKLEFFRIHVAGDFLSQDHVNIWINIAKLFPNVKFLAFTKCHFFDYSKRPENLTIIFSMFPGMKKPNKKKNINFAWVQDGTEKRIPKNAIHCPGSCENCHMCYNLTKIGQDVYFTKH